MGNKSPAVPPPILTWIQITVLTPGGGPVPDVEIEVWGLYLKKTGQNANRVKFSVSEENYDNIVAAHGNTIDVKVRKHHFGPPQAGSNMCTPGENHLVFDLVKGSIGDFTLILQDAGLNRFTDKFEAIPARELSRAQARDALLCLHREGEITLKPEPTFKHTDAESCDSACTVKHPMINEQISVKPLMAGSVVFRYLLTLSNDRTKTKSGIVSLHFLDPRYTVAVYRLVAMLKDKYQVKTLYHIGMSGDEGLSRIDCHGQGRALDFGGVGTETEDLYVFNDWGSMPVYDLTDSETEPAKRRRAKGFQFSTKDDPPKHLAMPSSVWPTADMELPYRLEAVPPGGNPNAGPIFQDVYTFATQQFSDTSSQPSQPRSSKIGQKGTFIMNPDHFTSDPGDDPLNPGKKHSSGREAHRNHMHIQIGKTGTETIPDPVAG